MENDNDDDYRALGFTLGGDDDDDDSEGPVEFVIDPEAGPK